MRLNRRHLRKMILAEMKKVLNEGSGYDEFFDVYGNNSGGFFEAHNSNDDAIQVHFKGQQYGGSQKVAGKNVRAENLMKGIAKATGKDLSKKDYFIFRGLDDAFSSELTELDEIIGFKGDPYLYKGEGGEHKPGVFKKLRVVGGHTPKSIGVVITNKKKKKGNPLGAMFDSSAQSSADLSAKSGKLSSKIGQSSADSFDSF